MFTAYIVYLYLNLNYFVNGCTGGRIVAVCQTEEEAYAVADTLREFYATLPRSERCEVSVEGRWED